MPACSRTQKGVRCGAAEATGVGNGARARSTSSGRRFQVSGVRRRRTDSCARSAEGVFYGRCFGEIRRGGCAPTARGGGERKRQIGGGARGASGDCRSSA